MSARRGQSLRDTALHQESANGLTRERVVEMQRARLLAAAGSVVGERGVAGVTVAQIVERAGVSRRTFYEIFADCEECVSAALQDALWHARARVLPAWQAADVSWRKRLRAALTALLGLFEEEPVLAVLLLVDSLGGDRDLLERRARVLEAVIDALEAACAESGPSSQWTSVLQRRLAVEGAVGGALGILHARVAQGATSGLLELTSPLTSMLVLPCDGPAAARRELARPAPVPCVPQESEPSPLHADPFKEAGMRLTYRTMRVLSAIAESPGLSNRRVGELAGMSDQGQASKLLRRLERLGLIANADVAPAKGEPNAWALTSAGLQVTEQINAHVEHPNHP